MGFFKRLFKSKRKKEPTIFVPEFNSSPYAAYSYSRRSQEQLRSPPREPVIQITKERARSISREGSVEPTVRSQSPAFSLAPSTFLDVNPDFRRASAANTYDSGCTTSTATSLSTHRLPQTRDTYRVKVHGRIRHSSTEFPFANPPISIIRSRSNTPTTDESCLPTPVDEQPLSPEDANRVLRLRQDPSVTSLLNVWDVAGRPRPELFANTPVAPRRKPTLRALLGSEARPKKRFIGTAGSPEEEGDISWAERFLNECLGHNALSSESLNVIDKDANKTTATFDTSCASEANDPAISSMQVERGTFVNGSKESISMMMDEPSEEILTNSHLVRSPSKRASQIFKFALDAEQRPPTPSSFQAFSNLLQEPAQRPPTPSTSNILPPSFLEPNPMATRPNSSFKPLPTPPPSLPPVERLQPSQSRNMGPRMPHEQRLRGGSLPLLSIEQFNQQYPDEEGDESILVTPSRPSKKIVRQIGKQSVPPLPTPSASVSSREETYNEKSSRHSRQRSQTLSRLDNPYLSSANPANARNSGSSSRSRQSVEDRPPMPSNNLTIPKKDFMSSLRQRTASAVGSIVSRSKNKRYSERFVSIEWDRDQYS